MSEDSSTTHYSPWIYFLSGSLLPSIIYYFLWKNQQQELLQYKEERYDDEYDSDDGTNFESSSDNNTSSIPKSPKDWGLMDSPYKMVLVVNQELKMGKGKVAAQCGHASVGCYQSAKKRSPNGLRAWEHTGCAKIALKCPTETEMRSIYDKAKAKGLPNYLVCDAGRTQIAAGSRTVLGIFGPTYVFDNDDDLTGHLKLL